MNERKCMVMNIKSGTFIFLHNERLKMGCLANKKFLKLLTIYRSTGSNSCVSTIYGGVVSKNSQEYGVKKSELTGKSWLILNFL